MKAREAVLKIMLQAGKPITPKQIAEALGKKPGTIRVMMISLREAGEVKPSGGYGLWTLAKTNALLKEKLTVARDDEGKKTNSLRKQKTNALKQAGEVELSEKEKARIAYNLEQNRRNALNPERKKAHNQKWREQNPDKVKASRIKQYAKKYAELTKGTR